MRKKVNIRKLNIKDFSPRQIAGTLVVLLFAVIGTYFIISSHAATPIPGDINGDGAVNVFDLSLLLSSFSQSTTQCTTASQYTCDLNSDGVVNIFDLSILLSHWGDTSDTSTDAPANTVLPVITGNTVEGGTLTATSGTWSNSPTSYAYQWEDCIGSSCTNINGATNSTYTVQSSDIGHSLAVAVSAENSSGSASASSYNTAAASPSTVTSSNFVDNTYLLGFAPPSGCSQINLACVKPGGTDPPNYSAVNEVMVFTLGSSSNNETPAADATTTASVSGTVTSIPANVTTTIPAGAIMLTTDSGSPSSGSYQIFQTSGAASGATSIPITGSPTANATYASGSDIMVWTPGDQNEVPTGSTLSGLVQGIHEGGAKALISIGGSNDYNWGTDCANGYQYLLGATLTDTYIEGYGFDGVEFDDEDLPPSSTCWNGAAEIIHSVATVAVNGGVGGQVPIVYGDFNPTDTSNTIVQQTQAQIDQYSLEYYGYNPTYDYNCAGDCHELASFISSGDTAGIPPQKWVSLQGINCSGNPGYSQCANTVLATTTASSSGSVSSIPVSSLAAAIPAGAFEIANTTYAASPTSCPGTLSDCVPATDSPPTNYEILETSGAAEGATSIPITGYCSEPTWNGTYNCTSAGSVTLNSTYASGDDIYPNSYGYTYPSSQYDGGWDCGDNAAYAATHNLLGVGEWYWDGAGNTSLCFNQIQPFL